MVCHRCNLAVAELLKKSGIAYKKIITGEVHLGKTLLTSQRQKLREGLRSIGLELIDNRTGAKIEKIKKLVIQKARNEGDAGERRKKLSAILSEQLHHDYSYLSNLFSSVEGRTIEHYFIIQRIEKVKELLVYDEMSLSAIALELEYSSVAHLSSQFRKVTGLSASHFKKIGSAKRKMVDQV
jgi:AraC-like DNA-binding protein